MWWQTAKEKGLSPVDGAPLVALRLVFAGLILFSTLRFIASGWVESQVVHPLVAFPFDWFSWLPRPGLFMAYGLFGAMAFGAILMLLNRPRLGALIFVVPFTYVELLDKTNYLNHYYFVSLMAGLFVFLPSRNQDAAGVPRFARDLPKLLLTLVYFYAGLAKLNADWMWEALPLAIWLPQHSDFPVVGPILTWPVTAYLFSWGGLIFDLFAGFALWSDRWRPWVYPVVVVFHLLTWFLFPIGVFPWVMMGSTLVFFSPSFHRGWLGRWTRMAIPEFRRSSCDSAANRWGLSLSMGFLLVQLALPWRFLAYPGDLFWTESGYRFSWRVMLMEKAGVAYFYAQDGEGREREVDLSGWFTPNQFKMMATQPDMIVQAAKWIKQHDLDMGLDTRRVRAEVWVGLNGKRSQLFVDPFVDLSQIEDAMWASRDWVLPLDSVVSMSEFRARKKQWRSQSEW